MSASDSNRPDPIQPDTIRVLIVDDHSMVRTGLAAFLRVKADLELVGEARDGLEALRQCEQRHATAPIGPGDSEFLASREGMIDLGGCISCVRVDHTGALQGMTAKVGRILGLSHFQKFLVYGAGRVILSEHCVGG